ncbi:low temperature requirement protein A [Paenibacillus sp. NEAU-GSW1]|uniref:low temperature requirement protein A n=1 Tax=Paenibacillus sp. NEAU-GSW1 TaxID=2682486 RepID=UPI0012E15361|nr:low temperature requirement protein A [Paenibacillus sp. NEAU-GSW1]MUT64908.1 low temperature requirement protein A [Paenibacillus sp. NEAU-GSW1]
MENWNKTICKHRTLKGGIFLYQQEKKVTWLELFYDLIFVAAVATTTHVLLHVKDGIVPAHDLVKFVLMFVPVWWAWVGQTLFINRFGQDLLHHRLLLVTEMAFVLIMTASLSVDFDAYYYSFALGYLGLRVLTALQYLIARAREREPNRRAVAHYLGTRFWLGISFSASSLLFDPPVRYILLYTGIVIDMIIPILGRRLLKRMPAHTSHLLERFGLFTIILFGESIVSTLTVLKPNTGDWYSIGYSFAAFVLILTMWWPYFERTEHRADKTISSAGQAVIYGHLALLLSLSMTAASIKLFYLYEINYLFGLTFLFSSALMYLASMELVFSRYLARTRIGVACWQPWLSASLLIVAYVILFVWQVPAIVLLLVLSGVLAVGGFGGRRTSALEIQFVE